VNRSISGPPLDGWFFGEALGIPITGMLVGFWGRPKLVLAIVPVAVGAMLFASSQRCRQLG